MAAKLQQVSDLPPPHEWPNCSLYSLSSHYLLHSASMPYMYSGVFEDLFLWYWNMWIQTHTITTRYIAQDLGEIITEILGDGSLQMMLLCYGWGCRIFPNCSVPSIEVVEHVDSNSHSNQHKHCPRFRIDGFYHFGGKTHHWVLNYGTLKRCHS